MKPSSLFALLFLFAFFTSSAKAQVYDTDFELVRNGGDYYILPHITQLGGGFELGMTGNETCPVSVVQAASHPLFPENGLPWKISIIPKLPHIPFGTQTFFGTVHVEGKVPNCVPMRSGWSVVEGEDGKKTVKISGVYENSVKGSFMIRPAGIFAFKIMFCPTNGDSCEALGFASASERVLALNGEIPMGWVFKKAESSSQSAIATI